MKAMSTFLKNALSLKLSPKILLIIWVKRCYQHLEFERDELGQVHIGRSGSLVFEVVSRVHVVAQLLQQLGVDLVLRVELAEDFVLLVGPELAGG